LATPEGTDASDRSSLMRGELEAARNALTAAAAVAGPRGAVPQ
jgi:hypothetical protein